MSLPSYDVSYSTSQLGPPSMYSTGVQPRYRRLSNDENPQQSSADAAKKQRANTLERISTKLQALAWILVSGCIIYYIDFFHIVLRDSRVYRFESTIKRNVYTPTGSENLHNLYRIPFNLAMVCLGANTLIVFYLAFYLPCIAKIHIDWSIYCPRMIPTATCIGVICSLLLTISLWPVWGFLSPLILLIVFLGFIFTLHFIPFPA